MFAADIGLTSTAGRDESLGIGVIPIHHRRIRPLPVLIAHGHDRVSLLELKDFLFTSIPYVNPVVMNIECLASSTLAEKFEAIARDVKGLIALLTPDDQVSSYDGGSNGRMPRARQNVIVEIGWFWGKLGRERVLLLSRGKIEIPSDLFGVEINEYDKSPRECSEQIRKFISSLS
jgi:predicted nucleotide-binding protein